MKHDYRMNWTLPALPLLGPAIKPREELDWDRRVLFETGDRYIVKTHLGLQRITEQDCKQINGAAQAPRSESVRSDILPSTTPEVAPPFKVGDRVRVVEAGGGEVKVGRLGTITRIDERFGGGLFTVDGFQILWSFYDEWLEPA